MEEGRLLLISHKKDGNVYCFSPAEESISGETMEEALKGNSLRNSISTIDPGRVPIFRIPLILPAAVISSISVFSASYVSGDYRLGQDKRLHGYGFFSEKEVADIKL